MARVLLPVGLVGTLNSWTFHAVLDNVRDVLGQQEGLDVSLAQRLLLVKAIDDPIEVHAWAVGEVAKCTTVFHSEDRAIR